MGDRTIRLCPTEQGGTDLWRLRALFKVNRVGSDGAEITTGSSHSNSTLIPHTLLPSHSAQQSWYHFHHLVTGRYFLGHIFKTYLLEHQTKAWASNFFAVPEYRHKTGKEGTSLLSNNRKRTHTCFFLDQETANFSPRCHR